jgi:hypothetical protein
LKVVGIVLVPADSERDSMTLNDVRRDPTGVASTVDRQSELMRAEVMKRYEDQRIGSGGREGLGVYGMSQERIVRKKVMIALQLLCRNGFDSSISNVYKITRQSRSTIERYLPPPTQKSA